MSDDDIARVMLDLAAQRGPDRTLCPSEVARALAGEDGDWRAVMPDVHRVAVAAAVAGTIELTQGGTVLPPRRPRGPYRLRLGPVPQTWSTRR